MKLDHWITFLIKQYEYLLLTEFTYRYKHVIYVTNNQHLNKLFILNILNNIF